MQRIRLYLHWIVYAYFIYLFGYASLFKVLEVDSMMEGMEAFGFGRTWTLLIGYGELLGLTGLIAGLWYRPIKNAAVLWLFPFAVGALMVHFSHHEYEHYYGALNGCVGSILLLATDRHFSIKL